MKHEETTAVEVNVSRYSGGSDNGDEITIAITVPQSGSVGKRRIYVTMAPAAFALALTGRGGVMGEMCSHEFPVLEGQRRS